MRVLRVLGILFAAFLLCGTVSAAEWSSTIPNKEDKEGLTLLKRSVSDVPIEDCKRRDICDLTRLLFVSEDYRVKVGKNEYQYFTLMYATYETATFATLEKYAFVPFIRGSVFTSQKDPSTGNVEIRYNVALASFNQWLVYRIPSWIIDSGDASPASHSVEGFPRHEFYRWQSAILPPPWITQEENVYGWDKPKVPRLYVDDDPQTALLSGRVAYNVSLEFKTCLYKSADIPQATTRDNTNFAEPLYCFPWRSSFVYDHDSKKFESPEGIVFPGLTGPNELIILGDKIK
ncbi:MAG: hypothetical protein Q7S52_03835 [bacterium]|nr:hypothetical protein [bacterium]